MTEIIYKQCHHVFSVLHVVTFCCLLYSCCVFPVVDILITFSLYFLHWLLNFECFNNQSITTVLSMLTLVIKITMFKECVKNCLKLEQSTAQKAQLSSN